MVEPTASIKFAARFHNIGSTCWLRAKMLKLELPERHASELRLRR